MKKTCVILFAAILAPVVAPAEVLPLTLDQAIEIAISQSQTVKIADLEIQKKDYSRKEAIAALFPSISATGTLGHAIKQQITYLDASNFDPTVPEGTVVGMKMGMQNSWQGGFQLSLPLIAPALWKSTQLKAFDVQLAYEQSRASKIDKINLVKNAYYNVLLAEESYSVLQKSYTNLNENHDKIKNMFEQGVVAEYDKIRSEVGVRNLEPTLFQAENGIVLAKLNLKVLMGIDATVDIDPTETLLELENTLSDAALQAETNLAENTNLKQIDIQAQQLEGSYAAQRLSRLPTLGMTLNYMWNSQNGDFKIKDYRWDPSSMLGVSLTIPLFDGFKRSYAEKQTKLSLSQIALQREETENNLRLAADNSLNKIKTSLKQLDTNKASIALAEKGYDIAKKRYETGVSTLTELNDAELALTNARLAYSQSIFDYLSAQADLEKVLGKQ